MFASRYIYRTSEQADRTDTLVEYSGEFQVRVAEELATLPHGSAIVEMIGDYAVMRDQARVC